MLHAPEPQSGVREGQQGRPDQSCRISAWFFTWLLWLSKPFWYHFRVGVPPILDIFNGHMVGRPLEFQVLIVTQQLDLQMGLRTARRNDSNEGGGPSAEHQESLWGDGGVGSQLWSLAALWPIRLKSQFWGRETGQPRQPREI